MNAWIAVAVTAAFASLAYWLRGVTFWGAIAGALTCLLLLLGGGWGAFAALAAVFALTWLATRLGYRHKQALGIAEPRQGRRASQVFANLSVAAVCAGLSTAAGGRAFPLVAAAAALAEAAGDTVSSEVGQAASEKARLVTTWREVSAGTDGAVSLAGSAAGILAAFLIACVCSATRLLSVRFALVAFLGALIGMFADSFLGAWLERRELLNNNAVNFLSTLIAAVSALFFLRLS